MQESSQAVAQSPFLQPRFPLEALYNKLSTFLLYFTLILLAMLPIPICFDVIARTFFGLALDGLTEIEMWGLVFIAFGAMPYVTASRGHISIDIFFTMFPRRMQAVLYLFAFFLCAAVTSLFAYLGYGGAIDSSFISASLHLPESPFIMYTAVCFALIALGMLYQVGHCIVDLIKEKDFASICIAIVLFLFFLSLPFLYKWGGFRLSRLALGSVGFLILMTLLMLRVPIGFSMACLGTMGLLTIMRTPEAAFSVVATVPYRETFNLILVAAPMFMLMGELASATGISREMFNCANKWMGRMPGGLACAAVGGCAGFGAICGESLPTVITMTSVALPAMRENNYDLSLSCGALAAGGTLGILIPPSMGFIFYSLMTEVSVGKLFIAGVMPGLLLTFIFICIIMFQVKRNPSLAPTAPTATFKEKVVSLLGLIPMVLIFLLVIGGILGGLFTPGEGGAVGAMGAFLYGVARRQLSKKAFLDCLFSTAVLTGKVFVIITGVYIFGSFLATSRLPNLLADFVTGLEVNRYVILLVVIFLYIILGCVMNVSAMLLLTLPAIFPTIEVLGFDGVWFGVVTVMVMEMGMITPPVGMNVFMLSSLAPDVPMINIFKGVLPFFVGMLICVALIIIFPQIALWLPSIM